MAKTNFTKVEEALTAGLLKMQVEELNAAAKKASGKDSPTTASKPKLSLNAMIGNVHQELLKFHKTIPDIYERFGTTKQEIGNFYKHPNNLSEENFEKVKDIYEKIILFKKELKKANLQTGDEGIIESERKKHINKRFNVKDDWLPMQ